MRKTLLALAACLVIISGCMMAPLTAQDRLKADGEIVIVDQWGTSGIRARASSFGERPIMRAVTLVVANPTDRPARVEAVCDHEDMMRFGTSREVEVPPRTKRKIMVIGFNECLPGICTRETLYCSLIRR
jgi:hypothetical protein